VQTIRLFTDSVFADQFWPPVVTGLAIAAMCSTLSVVVVLKRLSFVGQGISHAAFGAVGLAAVFAAAGASPGDLGTGLMVLAFSVASAVAIALLTGQGEKAKLKADTAIGIVLAGAMAIGFLLLHQAGEMAKAAGRPMPRDIESVLFGDMLDVGWDHALLAWAATVGVVAVLFVIRRSLLFWAFDEGAAEAFGIATGRMRLLLMVLLAVAVVTTMRLAGVVLATAMLVLPGATALALSDRLGRVLVASLVAALGGILSGIVLSLELGIQVGPAIVVAQCVLFGLAKVWQRRRHQGSGIGQ
jgi:ABC-type Mn2+/Zn2+ transport system permease subunit